MLGSLNTIHQSPQPQFMWEPLEIVGMCLGRIKCSTKIKGFQLFKGSQSLFITVQNITGSEEREQDWRTGPLCHLDELLPIFYFYFFLIYTAD